MARPKTTRRRRASRHRRRADAPPAATLRALEKAVIALDQIEARYALIGGQAVAARAAPRFTEDVDFAVAIANDEEAQQVVFALQQRGWVVRTSLEQTAFRRLATVRLSPPNEPADLLVDLLFAACGVEPEAVEHATKLDLGYAAPLAVASVGHLIAMKVLSESDERLQDRIDLVNLMRAATPHDLEIARVAVDLIQHRGYGRKKKLRAVFARFLKQAAKR